MNRKRCLDSLYFSERWRIIEDTANCIFQKKISRNSFQCVHHTVFQLCQAKQGCLLLESLEELFRTQTNNITEHLKRTNPDDILHIFVVLWNQYSEALRRLGGMLLYFKSYIVSSHRQSIQQMGSHIFCETVFRDEKVKELIILAAYRSCAACKRSNNNNNNNALRSFTKELLIIEGGCWYQTYVEDPFLAFLKDSYSAEAKIKSNSLDVINYLLWVRTAVEHERQQTEFIFCSSSAKSMESALYDILIKEYQEYILSSDTGYISMLTRWDLDSLRQVIDVYLNTDGVERLYECSIAEIRKMWAKLVGDSHKTMQPSSIIPAYELLNNTTELSKMFEANSPILRALHDVMNSSNAFIEALSMYYDGEIRHATKIDLNKMCGIVIELFKVVRDRDVFEAVFRNHLAARLIYESKDVIDAEQLFITMLKEECGSGLVSRLERMLSDVQSGKETHDRLIRAMEARNTTLPLDFHVTLLTSGFWPQYPNTPLTLPQSMRSCIDAFQQFYTSRNNGRTLRFQCNLGTVVFQLNHNNRSHSILAPTPFVNTIEALNRDSEISIDDVCQSSSLPRSDVEAQIRLLSQSGLVVLGSRGHFTFNTNFYSQRQRIRITAAALKVAKESSDQPGHAGKAVGFERLHNIDAGILKILKSRKAVDHDTLSKELTTSLQRLFTPTTAEIKARIEVLIEKQYLTRGSRTGLYVYSE